MLLDTSTIKRFWAKVNKDGPIPKHCPELGCCWIWTGSRKIVRGKKTYGQLMIKWQEQEHRPETAHRIAYILQYGSIPDGLQVLHNCDNQACVRGSHLYAGTSGQNIKDAYDRGLKKPSRMLGEDHPMAKLTESDVLEIRKLRREGYEPGEITQKVAKRLKIRRCTVEDIIYKRS